MLPTGLKLTEEQELIWKTAHDFAQTHVKPTAAARDVEHRFPSELVAPLAELGFFGVKVPVDDGGPGGDTISYALVIEALSEACASVSVTVAVCNLVSDILTKFANDDVKSRLLAPFLEGKRGVASFCLSEPEAGSDPAAMRMTAREDGDHYILDGNKQWITNGSHAGLFLVFAKTDPAAGRKGMSCFVVEKGTLGLTVGRPEKKMGLRSSDTVPLTFESCRVPARNLVGEVGQGYAIALSVLDGGRIGIASQALGIAEAALDEGVRYARDRKVFDQALTSFQATQFAIADSRTELDMAWLLMLRAASLREREGRSAKESSMAKLAATEACGRIVDRMLQLHGGYGYTEDFAIERLFRDARVTRIYEGASEIQRFVIGREVLR
jgi:alkylation response protein AidB-like acyl-CoA dehydrogenase